MHIPDAETGSLGRTASAQPKSPLPTEPPVEADEAPDELLAEPAAQRPAQLLALLPAEDAGGFLPGAPTS